MRPSVNCSRKLGLSASSDNKQAGHPDIRHHYSAVMVSEILFLIKLISASSGVQAAWVRVVACRLV